MASLAGAVKRDAVFAANADHWRTAMDRLRSEEGSLQAGGGAKAAER